MNKKFTKYLTLLFLTFTIVSLSQNKIPEQMEWLTTETEYDGLPLYLRLPNYKNIWKYKSKYPKLICITHEFDSVKDNGLPTSDYNKSLFDFDGEVIDLFQLENNGIVILVETYGGARNYWFYAKDIELPTKLFEVLKSKHSDKKLDLEYQDDSDWDFLKKYPVELYTKE